MTSNFQKCEDDPTIMTSEEEKFSVNDRDGVAVPNNLEEGNMQETTVKEDLLDAAQLSQEQGEGEARVHVEAEMDEQGEGDGGQMETEQAVESDRHEHAMAENCNDFLGSLRETSDTTPKSKTNEEADSSAVERMDEGHSLPENGSDAQADLQSTGKASCDVTDKSPVTTRKDGCDETPQTEVKEAINADCEGGETVATSSDSPHTKPDSTNFLSALNLLPRKRLSEELAEAEGSCSDNTKRPRTANQNGVGPAISMATTTPTLTQLFKKEPDSVVQLLAAAIPMDSLSSLLKEEHKRSSAQLKQLRERLEKAHQTVEVCSQKKQPLLEQIDAVTEKIQLKQKQLKDTREDLRRLSAQESDIKAKRDTIHSKCSELRRKLLASREALLQIQQLYANRRHTASKAMKAS